MLSMSDESGLLSMHRSKINLTLNLLPCMIYLRNTCLFRSLIAYAVGCLKKMQVSQKHKESYTLVFCFTWAGTQDFDVFCRIADDNAFDWWTLGRRGGRGKPERKRPFQICYHRNAVLFPKLKEEWEERVTNTAFKLRSL